MTITAILVNYRTAPLTIQAVAGLLPELEAFGPCDVLVVDNDSRDGFFEILCQAVRAAGWQDRVTVLAAPHNGGYGYGINVAVRHALARPQPADHFYVVNTDACPDPGSLRTLVAFMDAHPRTGLAGSHVHDPAGVTQGGAFRFPSLLSELESAASFGLLSRLLRQHAIAMPLPDRDQEVDWVPGTSMMIRRQVFEGGVFFDEGFFLYFEEIDFARRVRAAGWQNHFVAGAPINHLGSVSTGLGDEARPLPDYWFDSRHRYFVQHHGAAYAAAGDAAWISGYLFFLAKRALTGRPAGVRSRLLRDFVRGSVRWLSGRATAGPPGPPEASIGLVDLVAEDFSTHGRALGEPGFWAVLVHRLGSRMQSAPPGPARSALDVAYRVMFVAVDWTWGIHLPRSVALGRRVRLWNSGGMLLVARAIGDDVQIRHDTTLGPLRAGDLDPEALPTVEARADIGSGVCILGQVTVGHDAVVCANSVVLRNVPARATVQGVPARPVLQ